MPVTYRRGCHYPGYPLPTDRGFRWYIMTWPEQTVIASGQCDTYDAARKANLAAWLELLKETK